MQIRRASALYATSECRYCIGWHKHRQMLSLFTFFGSPCIPSQKVNCRKPTEAVTRVRAFYL